jgi:tRNA(Ile)-lysidine synthetase-like protein
MTGAILPSDPGSDPPGWGPDQQRLHRHLLHHPALLPRGASLLLAVSGGQDSMAMTGLLLALQRLHHWRLHLWHGDHGWRPESAQQAEQLASWAAGRGLSFSLERQPRLPVWGNREAIARAWRYRCLARQALRHGCSHVLTAHTASDRAETVLLHLARGSHRRGLAGLRSLQPLAPLLAATDPVAAGLGRAAGEPSGRERASAAAAAGDPDPAVTDPAPRPAPRRSARSANAPWREGPPRWSRRRGLSWRALHPPCRAGWPLCGWCGRCRSSVARTRPVCATRTAGRCG